MADRGHTLAKVSIHRISLSLVLYHSQSVALWQKQRKKWKKRTLKSQRKVKGKELWIRQNQDKSNDILRCKTARVRSPSAHDLRLTSSDIATSLIQRRAVWSLNQGQSTELFIGGQLPGICWDEAAPRDVGQGWGEDGKRGGVKESWHAWPWGTFVTAWIDTGISIRLDAYKN